MKKFYPLLSIFLLCSLKAITQVTVANLLTDNRINPVGIDVAQPQFSWQLISNRRNVLQTAYEIKVATGNTTIWESNKVNADSSVHVAYKGNPLLSDIKYTWQVRVWDNENNVSTWSKPVFFQTALLNKNDWKAKWIEPGYIEDTVMRPSPLFRKEFSSNKKIVSATAFITAHGMYEAHLNGVRIGEAYLTPGWTSYKKRLQYQTYDVTNLVKNGGNAIGVMLGNGWYRGIIGFNNNINVYGKDIALLFQLNIKYSDGSTQIITGDDTWKSSAGEVRYAEIYNGETVDARMNKQGWLFAGYDDKNWSGVKVADFSFDNLIATCNEAVTKHETFKPVHIFTTPRGEHVIDFGQNLVGWIILKAKGNAGDTITVSHAEVLDKEGNFYITNLREAKAQDRYILKDNAEAIFEPHFTWHGFRYAKIEGMHGDLNADNFTAVALYSDMPPTGTFASSNAMINQLQHNIQWGQKGNFLDVPTDCPQRDERLGWTGDAQVFSRTASFNMNVNSFMDKWTRDITADQFANGSVPFVIPNVLGEGAGGSTGWADVSTIVPWNMYLAYGDKKILADQYGSMKAWVDYMTNQSKKNLWQSGFHFGDWLFYRPDDDNSGMAAVTDKYLIAQCFYAHSTQLLINAANVLDKKEDAASYTDLLQKIKAAFIKEYTTPNGRLVSGTQTAYVLALNFDMLPDSLRMQAAKRLADNIKTYNNHLTTGFLGTPYLCHVLTRFGYDDMAYKLLLQDTYPSWLYPVKMGATTIWERWDGQKPDSTFETPGMNSFNHYAYGAIGDWMYRKMAGLDTYDDGVGYKHIKIQPHIGGNFTNASASLKTYYGTVGNSWKIDSDQLMMDVEIPANTTATIYMPASNADAVKESGKALSSANIKSTGTENGYVVMEVGSGKYHFSAAKPVNASADFNINDYVGKYNVESGMVKMIEVKNENGIPVLYIFNTSGEMTPLPDSKDHFTAADGSPVIFTRDAQNKVIKIKIESTGMSFEGTKQ